MTDVKRCDHSECGKVFDPAKQTMWLYVERRFDSGLRSGFGPDELHFCSVACLNDWATIELEAK